MPVCRQGILAYMKELPVLEVYFGLGENGVTDEIRKAVRKSVGRKKSVQLVEAMKVSSGVDYREEATRLKLRLMLKELELFEKQM